MNSKLIYSGQRNATNQERKTKGAEVVFTYEDESSGQIIKVYGCKCYESWEQWGAPLEVLQRNVNRIEAWRTNA